MWLGGYAVPLRYDFAYLFNFALDLKVQQHLPDSNFPYLSGFNFQVLLISTLLPLFSSWILLLCYFACPRLFGSGFSVLILGYFNVQVDFDFIYHELFPFSF